MKKVGILFLLLVSLMFIGCGSSETVKITGFRFENDEFQKEYISIEEYDKEIIKIGEYYYYIYDIFNAPRKTEYEYGVLSDFINEKGELILDNN